MLAISQMLLTQFCPNFKDRFLGSTTTIKQQQQQHKQYEQPQEPQQKQQKLKIEQEQEQPKQQQ